MMSEVTAGATANEHELYLIVKHVPNYRLRAADLLMQGTPSIGALKIVIEHVSHRREEAATMLLERETEDPRDMDPIFDWISTQELRYQAGLKIMKLPWPMGTARYAKVANEVPQLHALASNRLVQMGPDDVDQLKVVWRCTPEEQHDEIWARYTCRDGFDYPECILPLLDEEPGTLSERGWSYMTQRVLLDRREVGIIIRKPSFRARPWDKVRPMFGNWVKLADVYALHPQLRETVWAAIDAFIQREEDDYERWHILESLTMPLYGTDLNDRACQAILETYRTVWGLQLLLVKPKYRDQAAALLLAGDYLPEN